jgi:hypothetical protein
MLFEGLHDCGDVSDLLVESDILHEVSVTVRLQNFVVLTTIGYRKAVEKGVDFAHLFHGHI